MELTQSTGLVKMPYEKYDSIDAVRHSRLVKMAKSAAAYRYAVDHPSPDTDATKRGRDLHHAVLERDDFEANLVVWPGGIRRGNAWDEFSAEYHDKTILTTSERDQIVGMSDAVRAHPRAKELLTGAVTESVAVWNDIQTGLLCKARIDIYNPAFGVADLKSARDASLYGFSNAIARYHYHSQMAFYIGGVEAAYGMGALDKLGVRLIAVESTPPYEVVVYQLMHDDLAIGEQLCERWLEQVKVCTENDSWPGIQEDPHGDVRIALPAWAVGEAINNELDLDWEGVA